VIIGRLYSRRRSLIDYGPGYIQGRSDSVPPSGVLYGSQALSRRVTLYHQRSHHVVDEMWSGADGSFLFSDLAPDYYEAIARDYAEDGTRLRAGIQDFIWPATD
jgi:hypothetical protein